MHMYLYFFVRISVVQCRSSVKRKRALNSPDGVKMANPIKIVLPLTLIIVPLVVFSFADTLSYPISPSIILYDGKNQTGKSRNFAAYYVSDLSTKHFDNQAQSACVNGTWLLYDQLNYNPTPSIMEYVSGHSYCTDLYTVGQQASSLRFVGSSLDTASDSITFYSQPYFQGLEEYFEESSPYFETLKNGSLSFIVTGNFGWRIFERSHYQGESICVSEQGISGISSQPPVLMVPNVGEQYKDFLLGKVFSARQENCF